MPGTRITTATRSGPVVPTKPLSGQWFVVGQAERGRTDRPILLQGMADFDLFLGGRVSYGSLYDSVKLFFDEGGSQCWVARVVGTGAIAGTRTVSDTAATPVPTLRFDSNAPGSWSSNLLIGILAGSVSGTFRVQLTLNGLVVEDYNNLLSPADCVSRMSNSNYVNVTNLGSVSVAPTNNPAVSAATALSAGNDMRASITTATYTAALSLFTADLGPGAVSIPGLGTAVHSAIIAHCATTGIRVGILAVARATSKSDLLLLNGTQSLNGEFAGIFAPWVVVSDGAGGTRAVSPEGAAAADRSRAHAIGPWIVPAGVISSAILILDLDQVFTPDDCDDLDAAGVSMFRKINGNVRLYGYRTLSSDTTNYSLLNVRDILNYIVYLARQVLEDYVFGVVDSSGQFLSDINTALVGMVDPISQAGGLYSLFDDAGTQVDPGYRVDTGNSLNTPSTLASNRVKALLAVRPAPNGATIELLIVRSGFTAAV